MSPIDKLNSDGTFAEFYKRSLPPIERGVIETFLDTVVARARAVAIPRRQRMRSTCLEPAIPEQPLT
jgi:hypothetical protein